MSMAIAEGARAARLARDAFWDLLRGFSPLRMKTVMMPLRRRVLPRTPSRCSPRELLQGLPPPLTRTLPRALPTADYRDLLQGLLLLRMGSSCSPSTPSSARLPYTTQEGAAREAAKGCTLGSWDSCIEVLAGGRCRGRRRGLRPEGAAARSFASSWKDAAEDAARGCVLGSAARPPASSHEIR